MPDLSARSTWEIAHRLDGMTGRAEFSADRTRRLVLIRRWVHGFAVGAETLTWIMLNPSTAGAEDDDATIRKCIGYAQRWGFGGIRVLNLFDLIATDPEALRAHPEPSSPANAARWKFWLTATGGAQWSSPPPVIVAWGGDEAARDRSPWAADLLARAGIQPRCIGLTASGQPMHPGRTPYALRPIPWKAK